MSSNSSLEDGKKDEELLLLQQERMKVCLIMNCVNNEILYLILIQY